MNKTAAVEQAVGDEPGASKLATAGSPPVREDQQHRAGIASFVLAVLGSGAIVHTVLRVQGLRPAPSAEGGWLPGAAIYWTVAFGGALVLLVVALVLGLMGTCQKKRRRTLAVAGVALSFIVLAAILSVPLLE